MLSVATPVQASAAQHQTLADLPIAAQNAISSAIGQDQSAYHAASAAGGVTLANPANGFTAQLRSGALQVSAGLDTWDMSLVGLGYGGAMQPVGTAETSTTSNRVDVNYHAIDEWYVNGPGGLEQGFTVAPQPDASGPLTVMGRQVGNLSYLPQYDASGSLTVELALGGDLVGTVNAAGEGLTLTRPDGSTALGYTGLTACDATGKRLRASLEVRTESGHQELLIHVNATGAQGAITIDPFVQEAKLTASDGAVNDQFGWSVSISGNTMVVGAPSHNAAYIFTESGSVWTQAAKLTASDGASEHSFGGSVSISGNTVVVGGSDATDVMNEYVGAAYVFTQPASGWTDMTQTAKLTESNGGNNDGWFGGSVSVSGTTVVAVGYNAAYVFTEPASGWADMTQTAKLTPSDGFLYNAQGDLSVSISGNTVVSDGYDGVYVFTEPASGWANMTETAKLTSSDGAANYFGASVSIADNTVVVGAPSNSSPSGGVYLFTEPASGWADMTQTAKLTTSDSQTNVFGGIGNSVSINESGNTVAVSARGATVGDNTHEGTVYVFTEPASGWADMTTETIKLTASDGVTNTNFGWSLSMSGNTLVVGAQGGDSGNRGAAYVFTPGPAATIGVSSTQASGAYGPGTVIPITLTFNSPVNVSGTPQLMLNDGALANYSSGSGTFMLTFLYTVAAGQETEDLDYASTDALVLNDGSIQDATGNAAVLTLPTTGSDALAAQDIVIDATLPAVARVSTTTGPSAGGTTVTITGTGFAGATLVAFGSIPASSFTVNSATQITATSPAETAGTVNVIVVTPRGISPVSSADQFTYLPATLTLTPADWTSAGLTLTKGSDGNLHVYTTGTTTDAVPPVAPASVTNIEIASPSDTTASLTIDSTNGDPVPAGGLDYSGAGGLIVTGPGTVTLSGTDSHTGGTTVSSGTMRITAASALPSGTSLTVGAGGTFVFDPSQSASSVSAAGLASTAPQLAAAAEPSTPVVTASALRNAPVGGSGLSTPHPFSERQVRNLSHVPPATVFNSPDSGAIIAAALSQRGREAIDANIARQYADALAWLVAGAGSSAGDQGQNKSNAIQVLDALFAQYME